MKIMMNMKILIGALVGMGPNSTAPFYDAVINYARKLYGAKNDMDFPEMVLISLPTPFFPGVEPNHQQMVTILTDAITRLNRLEVNYIVIPCNIVHRYYDILQKASTVPILNIIDITVNKLQYLSSKEVIVALIGARSTVEAGLYQKQITDKGFKIFHTPKLQHKMDRLLTELKTNNLCEKTKNYWIDIVHYLEKNDCDYGIIACTDISPCIRVCSGKLLLIDSMDALAEATVEQYMRLKRFPIL
jgi:aspartate racemase